VLGYHSQRSGVESKGGAVADRSGDVHGLLAGAAVPKTVPRSSPRYQSGMQFSRTRLSEILQLQAEAPPVSTASAARQGGAAQTGS